MLWRDQILMFASEGSVDSGGIYYCCIFRRDLILMYISEGYLISARTFRGNAFSEGFNVDVYLGGISSGTCASGFGVCCVCKFLRLLIQFCLQLSQEIKKIQ